MSRSESAARSPLATALVISFAIAAGTVASTLDAAIFEEITSGRWLTRPFAATQERNSAAIVSLEQNVGAIGKDIDFVAARVAESVRRNEDLHRDRFAQIEARLAALKERFGTHAARNAAPSADLPSDVMGLRASLSDLTAAHTGAVAAITRRLDRVEATVGISTDMVSSVADPAARRAARKAARKPVSQPGAPLRLSRLPG